MKPTPTQYIEALRIVKAYESKDEPLSPYEYANKLCSKMGTTMEEIRSKNRSRPLVDRRRVLYYMMREQFKVMTVTSIARLMSRDHATLLFYGRDYDTAIQYEEVAQLIKMAQA